MIFETKDKEVEKETKNFVNKWTMFLSIITVIVLELYIFKDVIMVNFLQEYYSMDLVNSILAILSIIVCWLYYKNYNNEDLYIITLVYTSFTIEIFLDLFMRLIDISWGYVAQLGLLTYILRTVMLILIFLPKGKFKKYLLENDFRGTILIASATIAIAFVERIIDSNYSNSLQDIIGFISWLGLVIINLVIVYKFSYINIKSRNENCIILICSIYVMQLRGIFSYLGLSENWLGSEIIGELITTIAMVILVLGSFYEMFKKIKETEKLKEELDVFYYLAEYNPYNNILIYDEEGNVEYGNKLCRNMVLENGDIKEQLEILNKHYGKSSFPINENKILEVRGMLNKYKKIQNTIIFQKDKVLSMDVHRLDVANKCKDIVNFKNITQEYKINKSLIYNEARLNNITNNIKDIILTINKHGIITYINKSGILLSGYEKKDIIGKHFSRFLKEEEEIDWSKLKNQSSFFQKEIIKKDSTVLDLEMVNSQIEDEKGEVGTNIIVARDVSLKKEVESLRRKYDEIKEYEKIRSQFFANLSHEIRTPINILYSCIQLLDSEKEKGIHEFYQCYSKYDRTIKQNCLRMLRLVNNLIDMTKIDDGFIKINPSNEDIISLVENITMSVVPYVESKNINVIFDTDVEELEIKCDPEMLERVILNLISNSVKFTNVNGNIIVYVETDEKWVNIKVKDDGIGISKELKKIVFERFVQEDKSLNRAKEGSGIGLSLVKSLIELHNGLVLINDEIEEGTEIIIKLPNERIDLDNKENEKIITTEGSNISEKILIEFSDIYDLEL